MWYYGRHVEEMLLVEPPDSNRRLSIALKGSTRRIHFVGVIWNQPFRTELPTKDVHAALTTLLKLDRSLLWHMLFIKLCPTNTANLHSGYIHLWQLSVFVCTKKKPTSKKILCQLRDSIPRPLPLGVAWCTSAGWPQVGGASSCSNFYLLRGPRYKKQLRSSYRRRSSGVLVGQVPASVGHLPNKLNWKAK